MRDMFDPAEQMAEARKIKIFDRGPAGRMADQYVRLVSVRHHIERNLRLAAKVSWSCLFTLLSGMNKQSCIFSKMLVFDIKLHKGFRML